MSDHPTRLRRLAASPIFKAGLLLALILLLQLPLGAVSDLIGERQSRQEEVVAGFRQSWGPAQLVRTPVLAVPYTQLRHRAWNETPEFVRGWIEIRPRQVAVSARLAPETRRRGLFPAIVYAATLGMEGSFEVPALEMAGMPPLRTEWDKAVLVTQATDLRAHPAESGAEIDGRPATQQVQVARGACGGALVAAAAFAGPPAQGTTIRFRTGVTLHGTQSLALLPDARQLTLAAAAPWPAPGFTGASLPATYTIDDAGFRASWTVNGDNAVAAWRATAEREGTCLPRATQDGTAFGIDLLEPVPTYQMLSRAAKYGMLFLALAFLTYFLFEQVARIRIHLAQYALLGLSVSLFALLLVALAEPLGFAAGYALATAAVMAQASLYTLSVVGSARLAALFAAVFGLLFGFLYVVLNLDSLSRLAGAVALFAGLSAVMAATRRLDWSGRTAEV